MRSGPGTEYPSVKKLRNGSVLAISGTFESGSSTWYKIDTSEYLHYPERVSGDWYVASDFVEPLIIAKEHAAVDRTKRIVVDISDQLLTAYSGDEAILTIRVSTGNGDTPTPIGTFAILRKVPSRYMQGPLINGVRKGNKKIAPSNPGYYDLPGVPWNLYFTNEGAAIHGAYWHVNFGRQHSHGCVNLPPENAEELYKWAEIGTPVYVHV